MILSELATLVGMKVGKTDTGNVARAKTFLQKRLETLWNEELWKDSICVVQHTFDVSVNHCAAGYALLPRVIERVLAIRTEDNPVAVVSPADYFRLTTDAFDDTGTPLEFHELPPAVWMNNTAQTAPNLQFWTTDAADESTAQTTWIKYVSTANNLVEDELAIKYNTPLNTLTATPFEILEWTKPTSTGIWRFGEVTDGTTLLSIPAAETRYLPYPRIRLVNIPTEDTVLRVLGKRRLGTWRDYEPAPIRNCDDALVALATADMLQVGKQFGQAQALQQEALAMLAQLKRVETIQNAHNARLIPEMYHDDTDILPGKGYW